MEDNSMDSASTEDEDGVSMESEDSASTKSEDSASTRSEESTSMKSEDSTSTKTSTSTESEDSTSMEYEESASHHPTCFLQKLFNLFKFWNVVEWSLQTWDIEVPNLLEPTAFLHDITSFMLP